jgi:hypothetical protein
VAEDGDDSDEVLEGEVTNADGTPATDDPGAARF